MNANRTARVQRGTKETAIAIEWDLDGTGASEISTGIGFFDHMLTLFARHGFFDLKVACQGDLEVDGHHTVEDVGITMGQALDQALGDRSGIARYGTACVPMDEALARAVVDVSGRPYLVFQAGELLPRVGDYDTELTREFLRSLTEHGGLTLHADVLRGANTHHCLEALFKACARALDQATAYRPGLEGVLSTKGTL